MDEVAELRRQLAQERAARQDAERRLELERAALEPRLEQMRRQIERDVALKMETREGRGPSYFPKGRSLDDPDPNADRALHLRYLNEFIGSLSCADIMLEGRLFAVGDAAKEVTETMAAFCAARTHLVAPAGKLDMRDPGVAVVVVGDGSTPRAACLFALRTGWRAFSVDPQLKLKGPWTSLVQNVSYHRQMIEDFVLPEEFHSVVVVMIHTHVSVEGACRFLFPPFRATAPRHVAVIACPCCSWDKHQSSLYGLPPNLAYDDVSMLSPRRNMRIWTVDNPAVTCDVATWDSLEKTKKEAWKRAQNQRKALGLLNKMDKKRAAEEKSRVQTEVQTVQSGVQTAVQTEVQSGVQTGVDNGISRLTLEEKKEEEK